MEYESSGFDSADTDAERLRQIEEMFRQLAENIPEVLECKMSPLFKAGSTPRANLGLERWTKEALSDCSPP
jgi:hypothetical protein